MLKQIITTLQKTLSELTAASTASAKHAEAGAAINKNLKSVRESVERDFTCLRKETGEQFLAVAGVVLAEVYFDTNSKSRSRTALRKAIQKGIEIEGRNLKLVFPRKWTKTATVTVTLVEREELTDLEQIQALLGGLSDSDLNHVIREGRGLVKARKDQADAAEAARQLLVDAGAAFKKTA